MFPLAMNTSRSVRLAFAAGSPVVGQRAKPWRGAPQAMDFRQQYLAQPLLSEPTGK